MGHLLQVISSCLFSLTSVFFYFFPISCLASLSFLIWSIHLVLDLPFNHFPSIFVFSIFLDILSSVFCITCPYHLNLLSWMPFFISSTASSNLMLIFFILSCTMHVLYGLTCCEEGGLFKFVADKIPFGMCYQMSSSLWYFLTCKRSKTFELPLKGILNIYMNRLVYPPKCA